MRRPYAFSHPVPDIIPLGPAPPGELPSDRPELAGQFRLLARELLAAPFRAVGPRDLDRVLNEIVLDSLAPVVTGMISADAQLRILDLGCGCGIPALPLALALPRSSFVGIDASTKRIAYARKLAAKLGLTNIEFNALHLEGGNPPRSGQPQSGASPLRQADWLLTRGLGKLPVVLDLLALLMNRQQHLVIYSTTNDYDKQAKNLPETFACQKHLYSRTGSSIQYCLLDLVKI